MNAETTALRVLTWTAAPQGQPPHGPLWDVTGLRDPGEPVRSRLAETARTMAARLGAGNPPLGERNPTVGTGALLLAAAIGGRGQPAAARALAEAAGRRFPSRRSPHTARWYDALARHAVVAPAVLALGPGNGAARRATPAPATGAVHAVDGPPTDSAPIEETLLGLSPLTAVLHRPSHRRLRGGLTAAERGTAALLLTRARGREMLIGALSRWSPDPAVLKWRTELVTQLDEQDPELILDVCTAARLRHADQWDTRLRTAAKSLMLDGPADHLALATARFWAPLATKRRDGTDLARARPLLKGYEQAIRLVHQYGLSRAGTA
ncbi:hypothetical protein [Streptomyces spongiae]|uniref:FtsH ternary system domain-containing protein n=1 Tax=Streptomyces spongiae TaxID=565072 RepID=A0A5N8XH83_9ACTN|nr:hypothetical protein [Streptomyces spongiae]MPY58426.1 hypothetical protein [Streptomyces spongiae]